MLPKELEEPPLAETNKTKGDGRWVGSCESETLWAEAAMAHADVITITTQALRSPCRRSPKERRFFLLVNAESKRLGRASVVTAS